MFVGSAEIDIVYLKKIFKEPVKVKQYSESLIPKEFAHVKELQDNQLYFICMTLRKIGLQDYKALHNTIHQLLRGVRVTGYVDEIIEISYIYNIVNREKVKLYLERL